MESFDVLLSSCLQYLRRLHNEQNSLMGKLESLRKERQLAEESVQKLIIDVGEKQKKIISLENLLKSEKNLKQEFESRKEKIRETIEVMDEQQKKNSRELNQEVQKFEQEVRKFKKQEQEDIDEMLKDVDAAEQRLKAEIVALETQVEEESRQAKIKIDQSFQSFLTAKAEKEHKLRVKQVESEIVVEELQKHVAETKRLNDEELKKEMVKIKLQQEEWINMIKNHGKPKDPPGNRPTSPEPDPCLNQSSATGGETRTGRRKLPTKVRFELNDDDFDMF